MRFFTLKAALFFLGFCILSCKKDDLSTPGVIPESEMLGLITTDTSSIIAFTLTDDSIRSDETSLNLLGINNDPVFGIAEAAFYSQVRLSAENVSFGNPDSLIVDSVVLSLAYFGIYGNSYPQNFKVYQLSEKMLLDSPYYSTTAFSYNSTEIGSISGYIPDTDDSVAVGSLKEPAQLRIPINNSIGDTILKSSANQNNSSFLEFFKGLYIKPEYTSAPPSGEGAILYFNPSSSFSKLTVYYRNLTDDDTLKFDLILNGAARVNNFKFDRTGTTVLQGDTASGNEKIFIQSMGGTKSKIEIPFLADFVRNGKVAVNKAELILNVDETSLTPYSPHNDLALAGIDSTGTTVFLIDQFEGEQHFGGTFNSASGQYIFNVTRHMQYLLSALHEGKNNNYGFYLMANGKAVNANRTVIKGNKSTAEPLKLKISYTPL